MDARDRYDSLIRYFWDRYAAALNPEPNDWRLIKAQVQQESNFDPEALSPVGAVGLLQLMPATAAACGLRVPGPGGPFTFDDRRNPEKCIEAGIRHMVDCWHIWEAERGVERWCFALGSYNAGEGNILSAQKLAKAALRPTDQWVEIVAQLPAVTGPANSAQTVDYVRKIMTQYVAWADLGTVTA